MPEIALTDADRAVVTVTPEQHAKLTLRTANLRIAFYNKSGHVPTWDEFRLAYEQGFLHEICPRKRVRGLLGTGETDVGHERLGDRIGVGDLWLARSHARVPFGEPVPAVPDSIWRTDVPIQRDSYVTHFLIGSEETGPILGGAFYSPLTIIAGGRLSFGLRVRVAQPLPAPPTALLT